MVSINRNMLQKPSVKPSRCRLKGKCALRHICNQICQEHGASAIVNKSYVRGDTVQRSQTNAVLVIKSGFAIEYFVQPNGERFICVMLGEGDTIGETGALIEGDTADFFLAATDLEVCAISEGAFRLAVKSDSVLLSDIITATVRNTSNFTRQIWILQGTRVLDRIERLFALCYVRLSHDDTSNLDIPISHESLALIVHAERASVSKELKKLENAGLVTLRQNSILVHSAYWNRSPRLKRQIAILEADMNARIIKLI